MSSRNQYLGPEERKSATVLYRSLEDARLLFNKGERSAELLRYTIIKIFKSEPSVLLEYVAIVNPKTLEEVKEAEEGTVIALAARIGKTRLIDNIVL